MFRKHGIVVVTEEINDIDLFGEFRNLAQNEYIYPVGTFGIVTQVGKDTIDIQFNRNHISWAFARPFNKVKVYNARSSS